MSRIEVIIFIAIETVGMVHTVKTTGNVTSRTLSVFVDEVVVRGVAV